MTCDSTQRVSVLVMNLSAQRVTARWGYFGRRDAVLKRIRGAIHRLVHAQRLKHAAGQELVEGLSCDDFDQHAEDISAKVGVDVLHAWTTLERGVQDQGAGLERGLGNPPYVASSRQT